MLCGIRIVETQDKPYPPRGKLGERGSYQFRRSTWRMHTSSSFDLAENREVAYTVAKRHYVWIEAQLKANGIESSPYNVALAWNAGVNAVIRGKVPDVAYDYATRVLNIASSIPDHKDPEPAATPKPTWQPPVLVVEDTSPTPENPVTPSIASAPLLIIPASVTPAPFTHVISADSAERSDSIAVRFNSDPIMLAFNRSSSPKPATETPPIPIEVVANAPVVAEIPQMNRFMQLAVLVEKRVPEISAISLPSPRG